MIYYSRKFYCYQMFWYVNQFRYTELTTMSEQASSTEAGALKQIQQIPTQLLYSLLGSGRPSTMGSPHIKTYVQWVQRQYSMKMGESGFDRLEHCHPNIAVVWVLGSLAQHQQRTLGDIKQYLEQNQQHINFCHLLVSIVHNYQQNSPIFNLAKYKPYLGTKWHYFVLMFIQALLQSQHYLLSQGKGRLSMFLHYWRTQMQGCWIADYILSPSHHQFTVFKLILSLMSAFEPEQVLPLAKKYIQKYLKQLNQQATRVPKSQVFLHLKLLELFHISSPSLTFCSLSECRPFMEQHLYECLSDFETRGANVLGINIYASIVKQLGLFNNRMQAFVDLYLTLDCYGMHLVKDIWDRFYVLCRYASSNEQEGKGSVVVDGKQYHLYPTVKLLHLVLSKVEQHSNHNVPKYCIQDLLAANPNDTAILFEQLEDTVYSSLVQILNTGTHYTDCTHFHQDSKIYKLTRMFYLGYYHRLVKDQNVAQLQYHLKKLLAAMLKHITFQHCITAYVGILAELDIITEGGKQVRVLGVDEAAILVELLNKFMVKLTFRKRWKFMLGTLRCLQEHVDVTQLGLNRVVKQIIMKLPDIFLEERANGLPLVYGLVTNNLSTQIAPRIQQVLEELRSSQQELLLHGDLTQEEHKPKLHEYWDIQKQLVILQIIQSTLADSDKHKPIEEVIESVQQVSKSLYAHPLQHATVISAVARHCKYGNLQQIATIFKGRTPASEALLNLIGTMGTNEAEKLIPTDDVLMCLKLVAMGIQVSNSEPACRNNAKLMEYCISQHKEGRNSEYYLLVLINSLKYKLEHCQSYRAIEDSLYNLYQNLQGELVGVSPKYRLRVEILLFCILAHDFDYAWKTILQSKWAYVAQLRHYCNLYDYEFYDEFFLFCGALATLMEKAHLKGKLEQDKWDQYKQNICGHIQEAIKSMLHNLDYGIHKKEVVSSTERVVQIAIMLDLSQQALKLVDYILEVGEKYWGFQRNTVFLFLKQLQGSTKVKRLKEGFKKLMGKFLCIEEYRGEDSAILLGQHSELPVYKKKQLHPESDYDGTAVRFVTIDWSLRQVNLLIQDGEQSKVSLWMQIFQQCLGVCLADNSRERMFMTGSHKPKIKYCQFMMIFPQFLHRHCSCQDYNQIVMQCLESMSQNNLSEIKHYIEIFMLRLIYLSPTQELLGRVCQNLSSQLWQIEGQNSLLKNISYMMMSGLVLQLSYHHGLFSLLFSCVCSHIAYYRGLSQYFCYRMIEEVKKSKMKDSKYMIILHNQFLKDEDAIKLTTKLHSMVENYKSVVKNWNIYEHLLKLKPTVNGQVVSDDHYIDKLKHFGYELIKEHKHEDGFMPYRQAWKRIINQTNQVAHNSKQENLNSFQRKIDPSLDDLYSFEPLKQQNTANQLKVLIVSAHQIAFYGHMARVGQILGISELCIPNKKIIDMEQFYNVSVTAEKWLNITQHKFERVTKRHGKEVSHKKKPTKQMKKEEKQVVEEQQIEVGKQSLLQIVKKHKDQGYRVYLLKKGRENIVEPWQLKLEERKKVLVIVDEVGLVGELEGMADCCVSFNYYYSYHVQATILMWEYFKVFCIEPTT